MRRLQTTLEKPVTYKGTGLHLGKETTITFMPAEADTGIVFVRTDIASKPVIHVTCDNVRQIEEQSRRTTLGENYFEVHTVEHVLSALYGLEIDNVVIELDSDEPPEPVDGSVRTYVDVLDGAGTRVLDAPLKVLEITEPVSIDAFGANITVVPSEELRISFTIDFENPVIGTQYISLVVSPEVFRNQIAPSRTFCLYKDVKILQEKNMIRGGTLDNAIVIDSDRILNDEPLRFPDEFVRHKVLDLIGDLSLLGARLKGHVISAKSGHASNVQFVQKIKSVYGRKVRSVQEPLSVKTWDIQDIMELLPHRFPFLLVDRILEVEGGKRIVGLKNVSIDEWFFQGHFPGSPIMPGVLVIEAMAQVGGLMLFSSVENAKDWLVYFGGIDKVRFRKPITPGDQIVYELEMLQKRGRTCRMKGTARVDGKIAAEADLMAMLMERP
jgi:UDP-3-O-[3-hydroxymyristoyl] N-acetylglucosamine deacetylase/3-hydroxyacyl-[acyl-carrier-protein] dehydratase